MICRRWFDLSDGWVSSLSGVFCCACNVMGWHIITASVFFAFMPTYTGLCLGRLIAGAAVGFASVLVPLYIAEIAPAALRGALGCVNQLMICCGITVAYDLCHRLPLPSLPSFQTVYCCVA